jgi:glucose-6-phosphate-specific signal transduction histidine kinase
MNLNENMAQGKGEHLAAVANLLAVSDTQKPAFYRMTQQKFMNLVNKGQATPAELITQLQQEINKL